LGILSGFSVVVKIKNRNLRGRKRMVRGFRVYFSLAIMTSLAFITASTLSPTFMFRSSTASLDMSAVIVVGV
jgi:hypothetical protein